MNQNSILLRRRNRAIVPRGSNALPAAYTATINKNLEALGYTLSERAIGTLATADPKTAIRFHDEIVAILKKLRGVRHYSPMYPNFPRQVMEASAAELYLNATLHYLTAQISDATGDAHGTFIWLPHYDKEVRRELKDRVKLTVIDEGSEDEIREIFANIVASKTSISETDKAELKWFLENHEFALPETIPNKEVLAFVGGLAPERPELKRHIKTATDVLRLAVSMSGGDISLAEPTKFRNFARRERRALLALLEACTNTTEDMLRWKGRWVRLGERLHPGEYRRAYPKAAASFDVLRRDVPFPTFNALVEKAIRSGDVPAAVDVLRGRSGEFARRLDQLLRLSPSLDVVAHFGEVAQGVSTPVLLQMISHFTQRRQRRGLRIFFPKGSLAKVCAINDSRRTIPQDICTLVVTLCEGLLVDRFSQRPPLGKVFVDPRMETYLVPFSQRSASRSLRTLVRGSKIPLPESGDTIRFFLWWRESTGDETRTGRVDIDLSAVLYDERWNYKEHVSYTNLRSAQYQAYHSGDITSAPQGACEFIDIDRPSVLAYGGRYVVMSVNSFTGQPFSSLPECRAGWMVREHPNSGEVFEPKTVQDCVDIASDTRICIPVILDLLERKVVWADVGLKRNLAHVNNIEGNQSQMTLVGKAITQVKKPDLYTLFRLHAIARGTLVAHESDADTVFSLERGVTPFDLDKIAAEYL